MISQRRQLRSAEHWSYQAHVNHMQKALDQMNLQLHHVISDIVGQTGLAIIDALLAGESDPLVLAKLRNERIQATKRSSRNRSWTTTGTSMCSHCGNRWAPIVIIKS